VLVHAGPPAFLAAVYFNEETFRRDLVPNEQGTAKHHCFEPVEGDVVIGVFEPRPWEDRGLSG
jgi:hypothetical protein